MVNTMSKLTKTNNTRPSDSDFERYLHIYDGKSIEKGDATVNEHAYGSDKHSLAETDTFEFRRQSSFRYPKRPLPGAKKRHSAPSSCSAVVQHRACRKDSPCKDSGCTSDPECHGETEDTLEAKATSSLWRSKVQWNTGDGVELSESDDIGDEEDDAFSNSYQHEKTAQVSLEVEGEDSVSESNISQLEMSSPNTSILRNSGRKDSATTTASRPSSLFKGSDAIPGTKSPNKEIAPRSPKRNKARNEKFHRLFKNVPESDIALKAYSCAYFGDILLQGYLYISYNYFCFYSKILGHEKQMQIPVNQVLNLTRERTAFIIPNAIGIVTAKDKYVFGSLLSRDSTYRLMWSVWKQVKALQLGDSVLADLEQSDPNGDADSHSTESRVLQEKNMEAGQEDLSLDYMESSGSVSLSEDSVCLECGSPLSEHEPDSHCEGFVGCQEANNNSSQSETRNGVNICDEVRSDMTDSKGGQLHEKPTQVTSGASLSTHVDGSTVAGSPAIGMKPPPKETTCANNRLSFKTICKSVNVAMGFSRNNGMLALCSVIVLSLSLLALLMSYKLVVLQENLDVTPHWSPERGQVYSDIYFLKNHYHLSTVQRFHSVLEANIQLLSEVHESLRSLQQSVESHVLSPCSGDHSKR